MKINKYYSSFFILIGLLLLFKLFFSIVKVHSNSMLHTLKDGDYRLLYKTQNIERSDIVVFNIATSKYIKRGVGMLGDTIFVSSKGILTRNKQLIAEDYTNKERGITHI